MDGARHLGFVLAAYGVALLLLAGEVLALLRRSRDASPPEADDDDA